MRSDEVAHARRLVRLRVNSTSAATASPTERAARAAHGGCDGAAIAPSTRCARPSRRCGSSAEWSIFVRRGSRCRIPWARIGDARTKLTRGTRSAARESLPHLVRESGPSERFRCRCGACVGEQVGHRSHRPVRAAQDGRIEALLDHVPVDAPKLCLPVILTPIVPPASSVRIAQVHHGAVSLIARLTLPRAVRAPSRPRVPGTAACSGGA